MVSLTAEKADVPNRIIDDAQTTYEKNRQLNEIEATFSETGFSQPEYQSYKLPKEFNAAKVAKISEKE